MRSARSRRGWASLLLAATLGSLLLTIGAGYRTRLSLSEASWWVTHTDEVKLAIAACDRALDHGDMRTLAESEAKVARLTIDNPRQQQNVARAALLTAQNSRAALEDLFVSMQEEEDHLMAERIRWIEAARATSSAAFVVGAVLTIAFGLGSLALLRAQRQDMSRQRALLEAILESVDEGIIAVESTRHTIAMNAVARSMIGRSFPRDDLPDDWRSHLRATWEDGSPMDPNDAPLARAVRGETCKDIVYRILAAGDWTGVWVSTTARPIRDDSGSVVAAVATLRDITQQRATAERLRDLSLSDELTGLLNRRGFLSAATAQIDAARQTRAPLALLFTDINGLKQINDELGHEQGDRTIQDAACVLRDVFREGDIVARLGGDEFVAAPQLCSDRARCLARAAQRRHSPATRAGAALPPLVEHGRDVHGLGHRTVSRRSPRRRRSPHVHTEARACGAIDARAARGSIRTSWWRKVKRHRPAEESRAE